MSCSMTSSCCGPATSSSSTSPSALVAIAFAEPEREAFIRAIEESGKALISTLSDHEIEQMFRGKELPRLTAKSCGSVSDLIDELREVRRQGFATDNEETRDGMCCIGVPISNSTGGPAVAAVAVSMLKGTVALQKRGVLIDTLKELAQTLLHRLEMLR